jgi:flagellar basal body-associated protein FliL
MLNNILTNRKRLIYILIAILLVIAITVGVVFALKAINNNTNNKTTDTTITEATADTLKNQAVEALENDDDTKAKALFIQAKQQYEDLGDTNNVIDTEAMLYLIEHPGTPK